MYLMCDIFFSTVTGRLTSNPSEPCLTLLNRSPSLATRSNAHIQVLHVVFERLQQSYSFVIFFNSTTSLRPNPYLQHIHDQCSIEMPAPSFSTPFLQQRVSNWA